MVDLRAVEPGFDAAPLVVGRLVKGQLVAVVAVIS
jgi:hypothetical protein